jgi:hypothetical protein
MKKVLALSMVAALAFTACSPKENFAVNSQNPAEDGFYASISSETRTYLEEGADVYNVYWKSGDKIRCTDNENSEVIYETFDNGVKSAWFTHSPLDTTNLCADSTHFWAYYPSTLRGKRLPAIQQYVPNGLAAAPMRGYYMRGEGEEFKPSFEFKQLCGAIKLNVTTTQSDVKVRSIVVKADWGLSGAYSCTNEEPAAVMSSETSPATLNCPDVAIGSEAVPFFMSIPAATYYTFNITITTSDGRTQTRGLKAGESLTITRAVVTPIDLNFDNLQKPAVGETATFMKASDMNYTIKGVVNPDVSNWTDDDSTITRIVFVTENDQFSAVNIADETSESPIYVLYDEATTTVTISTPAKKFVMNQNSSYFFHRFKALTEVVGIEDFDASNMQAMAYFWGFSPMKTITMPKWDYTNVVNTRYMFDQVAAEKIDLSNMDFSNDTSFAYFFYYAENLQEIVWPEDLNVENIESMHSMFRGTSFTEIDMTMFKDTDNLLRMQYMFDSCPNLVKVKSNMTLDNARVRYMFRYACENSGMLDLTEFGDTSQMLDMSYMFYRCQAATIDISTFDTRAVEKADGLRNMFFQLKNLSTLKLGENFIKTWGSGNPTNFCGGNDDKTSGQMTSSVPGRLEIWCNQDTADWFATTLWRKLHYGSYGQVIDIVFKDLNTGNPISVEWAAE